MKLPEWFAIFLGFPAFLYVGLSVLSAFPLSEIPGALLGYLLVLGGIFVTLFGGRRGSALALGIYAVLSLVLVLDVLSAGAGGIASELAAGFLLASPFILYLWGSDADSAPGVRFFALGAALADGIALLATLQLLASGFIALTTGSFVASFFTAIADQALGWAAIFGGSTTAFLPYSRVFDPTYFALAALATVGVFLGLVRPVTGRGEELPVGWVAAGQPTWDPPDEWPSLRPSLRGALEERSRAEAPPSARFPGLGALAAGVGAALAFLGMVFVSPALALPVVAGVSAGAVAVTVAVIRRPLG